MKSTVKNILARLGLFSAARRLYQRIVPSAGRAQRKLQQLEDRMLPHYQQFVRPGDTAFDIGANFGTRVAAFLKLGAARVVAVDPNPQAIENLKLLFGKDPRVAIVAGGLAEAEGERELMFGKQHALSTMSPLWIEKLKTREGYSNYAWNNRVRVSVTTLDALIAKWGTPSFVKIDVEGFEDQVLQGLSTTVPALSFEFNVEYLEPALASIKRLSSLGSYEFNLSLDTAMHFRYPVWMDAAAILQALVDIHAEGRSGDVYARLKV